MKLSVAPIRRDTAISSLWVITCSRTVLNTTATTTTPSVAASNSRLSCSTCSIAPRRLTKTVVDFMNRSWHRFSPYTNCQAGLMHSLSMPFCRCRQARMLAAGQRADSMTLPLIWTSSQECGIVSDKRSPGAIWLFFA